jgi:hypothetical protein
MKSALRQEKERISSERNEDFIGDFCWWSRQAQAKA